MFTCKICDKEATHLWRCEEHYRCDVCGTKEDLITRRGGITCDNCHAKIAQKQVEEFDGDTDYTREIICPWCGDEQSDSWEAFDEDDHVCDNCWNKYSHTRDYDVTYCTTKTKRHDR